jgi:hypothetical protein
LTIKKEQEMNIEFLSHDYLTDVKKRADAATAGPWTSFVEGRDHLGGDNFIRLSLDDSNNDLYLHGGSVADQDFIAHARQDIPLLLEEIERMRKLLISNGIIPE